MTSKKTFFVMIGVIVLLAMTSVGVLVAGTVILRRQSERLVELKLERILLDEQQAALVQANKDIEKYAELEQISKSVVPQDKDQAKAVREIIDIADQVGIRIRSISFPSSNLGAAPTTTPSQSDTGDDSQSASKPATPSVSQASPVDGVAGVYSLEMNIVPDTTSLPVTYYQFLDFLERLENNRRTAQVTRIKIDPVSSDQENPYITFTLTINIFIKP